MTGVQGLARGRQSTGCQEGWAARSPERRGWGRRPAGAAGTGLWPGVWGAVWTREGVGARPTAALPPALQNKQSP